MASANFSPRDLSLPRFALRRDEAAASLGISETTFAKWIELKRMPPGRKIDGIVLWDTQEICDSWQKLKEADVEANPFDGITA